MHLRLCGNCTEVCAVKINLHELLLENSNEAVESGLYFPWRKVCVENMEEGIIEQGDDEHG